MYKSVEELTKDELDELRETYFYQMMEEEPETTGDITEADKIPDDILFDHYEGVQFVEDDFFCNQ